MEMMVSLIPGVDQDVIDVDLHEAMEVLPEHLIHKSQEYRG